jgi:IMP dehydrogenase
MQEIYAEPIKPELISSAHRRDPRRGRDRRRRAVAAAHPGVLQGPWSTPASTSSSSAAPPSPPSTSPRAEPLNLKQFIYELDVPVIVGGAATYRPALHLMRTGAAGVLVGLRRRRGHTTRVVARHPRADGHRGRRRRRRPP